MWQGPTEWELREARTVSPEVACQVDHAFSLAAASHLTF